MLTVLTGEENLGVNSDSEAIYTCICPGYVVSDDLPPEPFSYRTEIVVRQ